MTQLTPLYGITTYNPEDEPYFQVYAGYRYDKPMIGIKSHYVYDSTYFDLNFSIFLSDVFHSPLNALLIKIGLQHQTVGYTQILKKPTNDKFKNIFDHSVFIETKTIY